MAGYYPPPQQSGHGQNQPYHQGQAAFPPQQAPYGAPPQGYQQGYQQQQPGGYPPQSGFAHPPPPHLGGPLPQHLPPQPYGQQTPYHGQQPPPHGILGPYGAPYGFAAASGPPAPPSLGYVANQIAPQDLSRQADAIRAAMKGFGTDEKSLIANMAPLDPLQVNAVKQAFTQRHRRNLIADIQDETSGYFRDGLVAITRGPLLQDVFNLDKAISGLGTKETVLNDVLLGRSNADMNAIKAAYQQTYRRSLESDVKGDLSMKTERLFTMVLSARRNEESSPVIPQQVEADVQELYRSTEGQKMGTDQITACSILSSRSDGQIRAISQAYRQKYHRSLGDVLEKSFSGHMEDALLFMLRHAEDRAKHDADLLEATMKGMGTKDDLLVNRVVRIHWDKQRLQQAKAAYKHFYKQDLRRRIQGETSGEYERLMVAMVDSVG